MIEVPFHTATQFAALALTLLAGWLFGLASSSGGKKWRERHRDVERALREANQRIRELESENARLAVEVPAVTPVPAPVIVNEGHSTATVAGAAVAGAVATHAIHEAKDGSEAVMVEPAETAPTPPPAPLAEAPQTGYIRAATAPTPASVVYYTRPEAFAPAPTETLPATPEHADTHRS